MAQLSSSSFSSNLAESIVAIASPRKPASVPRPGLAMPSHQSEMTEALSVPGAAVQKQHTTPARDRASLSRLYIKSPFPVRSLRPRALLSLTLFLASLSLLLGTATAQQLGDRHHEASVPIDQDFAWKAREFLIVDKRPPPLSPVLMHLYRRADATSSSESPSQTLSVDENAPGETAIPRPFDTALGNNFTAPCSAWFKSFLADETLNACHPFSLLLQTSTSFFDASKSYARITRTLEATCNVNSTVCLGYMQKFARDIKSNDNCAVDYANDNPSVLQAYNGLISYQPLYQAACLQDGAGSYCFANAITNASAVTDSYPYYLPLGVSLPGGARPSCSTCLQNTMSIFSSFAGNTTQPISRTYSNAAQQLEINCGPTFVNQSATPLKAAASGPVVPLTGTMYLLITFFFYFLL